MVSISVKHLFHDVVEVFQRFAIKVTIYIDDKNSHTMYKNKPNQFIGNTRTMNGANISDFIVGNGVQHYSQLLR